MPLPLIAIGAAAAALSIGSTVHSTMKTRKWQKLHNEALVAVQETEKRALKTQELFNKEAENLGRLYVAEFANLKRAADFLQNARLKHRDLNRQIANIPMAEIGHWQHMHNEATKSLGIGALGTAGTAGAGIAVAQGLYTAAGILGTASTGAAISGLSGAAANSARLAWLGGGALSAGGAGVAGGLATMMTAANVVMAPVAIGAAAWGQWKAHRVQKEVEVKLKEFAAFETKTRSKEILLEAGLMRIRENRKVTVATSASLKRTLSTAESDGGKSAYSVYLKAKALSECLGAQVLTPQQLRQLNR